MAAKGYCTAAMVAGFLGVTFTAEQEAYCNTLIERAERFLDGECRRAWLVGEQTDEAHYAPFTADLFVRYPPIEAVTAVTARTGLGGVEEVLTEGEDYEVRDLATGWIRLESYSTYDRIRVTYTPVDAVPKDVEQAMVELVADWMQPALSGVGLTGIDSYRLPDLEVRFRRLQEGERVPASVRAVIEHYRFVGIG